MTAIELRDHFNRTYGLHAEWPKTFTVDAATYAHACQHVFDGVGHRFVYQPGGVEEIRVILGPSSGLMFKNVELILCP